MSDAISATRRAYKELVDGTLRVQFDIDPSFKNDFLKLFPEIDTPAGIAPLELGAPAAKQPTYGTYANTLWKSNFLEFEDVWRALGTDKDYRAWIQDQVCVVCGDRDYVEDTGDMKCEAHHVRRSNTFGTGMKAQYACVSLCNKHHRLNHNKGESALGGEGFLVNQMERQRIKWAWDALKTALNVSSMKQASPEMVRGWAEVNNVESLLP